MSIRITDSNLDQYFWSQNNLLFWITGNNDFTVLGQSSDAMAFIYGTNDTFSIQNDTHIDIVDHGTGTSIIDGGGGRLTVYSFQRDPTGSCEITCSTTAPVLSSDNNGGTLVSYSSGSIDFVGDRNLSAAQIHWGAGPFPTTAPAVPTADPTIIVNQPNQIVPLNNATDTTVVLQATGAMIELSNACQITVDDFTRGMNAHVIFEDQGLYAQTVMNDGNGGTMVRCGPASVDFAGVVLDPERGQITYTSGDIANRLLEVNSL